MLQVANHSNLEIASFLKMDRFFMFKCQEWADGIWLRCVVYNKEKETFWMVSCYKDSQVQPDVQGIVNPYSKLIRSITEQLRIV